MELENDFDQKKFEFFNLVTYSISSLFIFNINKDF